MVVAAFFDKLVSEILKARIPNPVYEDHKAWNSAIHVSLIRIYKFFGKGEPPEKISNLFLDSIKAPDTSDKADSSNVTEKCSAQIGEIRPLIDDPITHPSWYNRGGIETLDFIEAKGLNFTRGNAVKYITRAGYKDPAQEIQDLKKARFYIDWEINRLKEKG
ncbi:MAG: DUF3310 domain-containing protein [Synergistaceae bacterium]|nr:DUF3310 domain-containing protein [Synergistaceae bacterium]